MGKVVNISDYEPPGQDARPPEFSDEALALRFAAAHAQYLRYVESWKRWLEWDGTRWRVEETLRALDLARALCRQASAEAKAQRKTKIAAAVASRKTVAAVESLARADRRLAATTAQWDRNPDLLNTPAGTIDLRTGRPREARREDYITKRTAAGAGGDCPRWLAFLDRVTGGDKELERFLQRMAGYAATGSTQEHALFFLYGTGANGKSVFVNTLAGVLGDYAVTAAMETFAADNGNRHPTELAGLCGARLVTATETESGQRWGEARIKKLTGGDKIRARFMRQDFFEFAPEFKLVIAGNHKPALRGVDEAIRRRMNLVPFTVTIPIEERDERLSDALKEEWPGILQWVLDGCAEWQGEGLAQPEAVRTATEEYIADEDAIGQWLADRCIVRSTYYSTVADLFASWRAWADKAGEFIGSQKRLSQTLQDRGFAPRRQGGTGRAGFDGIGLQVAAKPAQDEEGPL